MERIVLSKKFFINALFILIFAIMLVSVTIKASDAEYKTTLICIIFCLLDVLFAFLNAYFIPFAFYFDESTVEIRYIFKRKSKKWLWTDITKIELEYKSRYDMAFVPKYNIGGRLFRESFRLEHVDKDGKVEYELIVNSEAAKECIDKYRQV